MAKRKYTKKQITRTVAIAFAALCLLIELIGYIPGVSFNGWSDISAALGMTQPSVTAEGELEVHFIDVGNADCIFIRQQDKTLLIDAGESTTYDRVKNYLMDYGVTTLDIVVATHPHADHIGGMPSVLEDFEVGQFIMSFMPDSATPTTKGYLRMLELLDEKNVTICEAKVGDVYELGTARLQILGPIEETTDKNNMSVITRLTFGDRAFLFTGDAESGVEKDLVENGYDLTADVMKLGHHGSKTSNSSRLLSAVSPQCVVATCGKDNDYGHPSLEVLRRLEAMDITLYRADVSGHIVITSDGEKFTVRTEKE
mgnify:FL=1